MTITAIANLKGGSVKPPSPTDWFMLRQPAGNPACWSMPTCRATPPNI